MSQLDDTNKGKEVVSSAEVYNDKARFERDRHNPDLAAKNRRQADVALRLCGKLPYSARIVDFPCGPGHHTDFLYDKGYSNITAIEGSEAHVEGLKNDTSYPPVVGPYFKHAYFEDLNDPKKTVADESTDAFFCFGESVGFMPTLKENEEHMKKMYDKLKPGGTLVIQGRYTPDAYEVDAGGVPTLKDNPSRDLQPGETKEENGATWFSNQDFQVVENFVSQEFAPDLEDGFRNLEVTNYAVGKPKPREDGSPITMKMASYFVPKLDRNGVPVDYPVLRAFSNKLGFPDVKFDAQLDYHDKAKTKPYYICSMVIKKPGELKEAGQIRREVADDADDVFGMDDDV